nr:ABC transporter permease [uncultured Acetatifactor sp.]
MKRIVLGISGGISFLIFLILLLVSNHLGRSQLTQTAAQRWSEDGNASQVSCFFSVGSGITEDALIEFEHTVDAALTEASVVQESENPGARLWADAYSADGQVTLSNGKTNLTADAIGIGGDFFLFHPLTLLNGSYFSGNDLMKDYCVIDEDAAWQLFGSNDVAGMTVYIGGVPHIVTGVIRRPSGHFAEAAGLDSTVVYVSYQTLTELGDSHGINHYEIVMPNPVTGFAYNYVKEKLGAEEKEVEVVENTSRYSLLSRLKLIAEFGTRSMNGKAIIYPYWENIARGYADVLMVLTLFGILFLLYPVGLAIVFFCIWWRHKGWTMKDVWHKLQDFAERRIEKLREKRKERKAKEAGEAEPGEEASGKKIRKKRKKRKKSEYDDFDEAEEAGAEEMPGERSAEEAGAEEMPGERSAEEAGAEEMPGEPSAEEAGAEEMSGEQSAEGARKKRRFGWRRGGRKNEEA